MKKLRLINSDSRVLFLFNLHIMRQKLKVDCYFFLRFCIHIDFEYDYGYMFFSFKQKYEKENNTNYFVKDGIRKNEKTKNQMYVNLCNIFFMKVVFFLAFFVYIKVQEETI
jgi:hypothetical protein